MQHNRWSIRSALSTPRRAALTVGAAGLIVAAALGTGWGVAAAHANAWAGHSAALQKDLDAARGNLKSVSEDRDTYLGKLQDAATEKAAAEAKQHELDSKLAAADDAKSKLAELQKQFDEAQKQAIASELSDGVHVVGTDTAAGTYSIATSSTCYYAWKSGTGSDATIIDNNIVDGPATVTLRAGDVFETKGCGVWKKTA